MSAGRAPFAWVETDKQMNERTPGYYFGKRTSRRNISRHRPDEAAD